MRAPPTNEALDVPRTFFHRTDGGSTPTPKGAEPSNLDVARLEAVQFGTTHDRPEWVGDGEDCRIEVTDQAGMLLCTVVVLGIDAPTVRGSGPSRAT